MGNRVQMVPDGEPVVAQHIVKFIRNLTELLNATLAGLTYGDAMLSDKVRIALPAGKEEQTAKVLLKMLNGVLVKFGSGFLGSVWQDVPILVNDMGPFNVRVALNPRHGFSQPGSDIATALEKSKRIPFEVVKETDLLENPIPHVEVDLSLILDEFDLATLSAETTYFQVCDSYESSSE